jgi:transposase-like protein
MINIQLHKILDVSLCWDILRSIRWETGVHCPHCTSTQIVKNGKDPIDKDNQHYHCKTCNKYFDDLSDTLFSGSQQPLHHWITVLYLMNLNVSNRQISQELDISEDTAQWMCSAVREGVVKKSLIYLLAARLNLTNVTS